MAALMAASRGGISTRSSTLYVTVFPCHNCARHLVAAGVEAVYFIEPYVKSLAYELHSDSIAEEVSDDSSSSERRMTVAPFTGVGPRMYDDFFSKRKDLKGSRGRFDPKDEGEPYFAVRLRELNNVEDAAVDLVPDLR
jgi:deoxycytidylate deaminase